MDNDAYREAAPTRGVVHKLDSVEIFELEMDVQNLADDLHHLDFAQSIDPSATRDMLGTLHANLAVLAKRVELTLGNLERVYSFHRSKGVDDPIDFNDLVWAVVQKDDSHASGWRIAKAFELCAPAKTFAESLVGNSSFSQPSPGLFLYGDGTGNTTVIVRQDPRCLIKIPIE